MIIYVEEEPTKLLTANQFSWPQQCNNFKIPYNTHMALIYIFESFVYIYPKNLYSNKTDHKILHTQFFNSVFYIAAFYARFYIHLIYVVTRLFDLVLVYMYYYYLVTSYVSLNIGMLPYPCGKSNRSNRIMMMV